MKKVTLS